MTDVTAYAQIQATTISELSTCDTYNNLIVNCTNAAKKMTEVIELYFATDVELDQVNQRATNCLTVAATNL